MGDIRYYEERPCEDHGEIERHHYQTPETYPSGEYKYEWCPGGSRREITVDYTAAASRLAAIHQSWATQAESCRESAPCYGCRLKSMRAIEAALGLPEASHKLAFDAALGRGDTREENQ